MLTHDLGLLDGPDGGLQGGWEEGGVRREHEHLHVRGRPGEVLSARLGGVGDKLPQ